jgi:hypothetical protein
MIQCAYFVIFSIRFLLLSFFHFRMRADEALQALDLITDISLTDDAAGDKDPTDQFVGESDTDSVESDEQMVLPPSGTFVEFALFPGSSTDTHA